MKKVIFLVVIFLFVFGCRKHDDNEFGNSNNSGNSVIKIKGKISATAKISGNSLKSGNLLSLADAKKVLIFNGNRYNLVDIVNGSFVANGSMGTATVLVFLDTNNKYIGNLYAGGLNVLPLDSLKDGKNTTIDLTTLTLSGTSVIPAHNPLGDEIRITDTEINCLKEASGYYESLSKNIDANNDGVPDILSSTQIYVSTLFAIFVGKWGINTTPPAMVAIDNFYINYTLFMTGASGLSIPNGNIVLSGPDGDPYNDIASNGSFSNNGFVATFKRETRAPDGAPWGSTFLPFKGGVYTLTLGGNQIYTLNYTNIGSTGNLVLITPTLHTNSDGKLTSISLAYKLSNGSTINPSSILTQVTMQGNDVNYNLVFDTSDSGLTNNTGYDSYLFKTPVDISAMGQLGIFYVDILGNTYNIIWHKPDSK